MRKLAIGVVLALAGGCSVAVDEEDVENAIREKLAEVGDVRQVEMMSQEDGSMVGFVMLYEPGRRVGRLNCSAAPADASTFDWRCWPAIDEPTLREIEDQVRAELEKQSEVLEVDLAKAGDDDHMDGFARVRDRTGAELRLVCFAKRNPEKIDRFKWTCREGGGNTA